MFDIFNLGWPEGAEEALTITALMDESEEYKCPKCGSILSKLSDGNLLCKKCKVRYVMTKVR